MSVWGRRVRAGLGEHDEIVAEPATSGPTLQAFQPAPGGGDWAPLH
eukprot:CAMPEP_0182604498 /NCGR_PEP_ID=MMETSP1324-20130603/93026_1 /TAXON_ID=236786 /ORGANISM="Florenciella sp., Strain RCC1587" /LENGTH=45 /DNA_ID= /DNA_START= /DNA_END= /DNA_ORIENTATION=